MAVTLDRAVEASEIVDALKPFGVTQVDVAAVIQVSDRAVRGWRTGDIRPERYDRLAQLRDLVLLLSDSLTPEVSASGCTPKTGSSTGSARLTCSPGSLRGCAKRGGVIYRRRLRVKLADAIATAPRRTLKGTYWHQGPTRHPVTSCADPARVLAVTTERASRESGTHRTKSKVHGRSCSATSSMTGSIHSRSVAASVEWRSHSRYSTSQTRGLDPI